MADGASERGSAGFAIFRLDEAQKPEMGEYTGMTEVSRNGLAKLREAGLPDGIEAKVLYDGPGFNLAYGWIKSGFPVFRHSHGPDCLYQVIGGELHLGDQVLKKGDGFFVPAGAPYAFTAGPEGAEFIEFRHEACHHTHVQANNPAFWEKALELVTANHERWKTEKRPS
jgi:hypothetical protein